jgi:hypothetical protein
VSITVAKFLDVADGLRDPSIDERRVLFEMEVVRVATFVRP